MAQPRITIETVQHGYELVDCSTCGVLGVYHTLRFARVARDEHVCGHPASTIGKVQRTIIVGPTPGGMSEPGRE
jgi:hypothetical protein